MTALAHHVNVAVTDSQFALTAALEAIRAHQSACAALAELPDATQEARDWAANQVADAQAAWLALDRIRWNRCPWPGNADHVTPEPLRP